MDDLGLKDGVWTSQFFCDGMFYLNSVSAESDHKARAASDNQYLHDTFSADIESITIS